MLPASPPGWHRLAQAGTVEGGVEFAWLQIQAPHLTSGRRVFHSELLSSHGKYEER